MLLVTGGAGFIGSNFVLSTLARTGEPVVTLDKLTYAGNLMNLRSLEGDTRHAFVRGDIGDRELVRSLLQKHKPRAIVHFAAESHVDRSISGAADFVVTNVLGAQTVFDAALRNGVPRVVHVSTDEVYGSIEAPGEFRETDPLLPNSPYSAAKAGADLIARAYYVTHGLNISVTRCSNNYGPYQFPEKLVPLFVTNLMDGRSVPLYGDGMNVRDWLFVDDHCRGIQLVLDRGAPGEVYNIGGGVELPNRELVARLLDACGATWDAVEPVEDRKGHDRRYAVDDSKLRALGYAPATTLDEGLAATVRWYHENEAWWRPLKEKAALPA
jgi:dTDP-glucose 4,6-dehydratase